MLGIYIVMGAALTVFLGNFFDILKQSYSWWLMPLMIIGFVLAFLIIHTLIIVVMVLTTNTNKPAKNTNFFRSLLKSGLPILFKLLRIKINAEGLEKIPQDGRVLVLCNHQHDFDPAVIISQFPDSHLAFIGKKDIYQTMPFIAKAMHRLECLPIDRENDREAAKTIVRAIKMIKDDVASIALFPEGYTSKTGELLPLRNGSLKIALKTGVPVAICVIDNMRGIHKRLFIKKNTIEFRLVDVIESSDYENLNTAQLGEIVSEKMQCALDKIRKK